MINQIGSMFAAVAIGLPLSSHMQLTSLGTGFFCAGLTVLF